MIVMDPSQSRGLALGCCGWWSPRRGRVGHEDGISGVGGWVLWVCRLSAATVCSFSFT